jgi:hypothetical protein
MYRPNSTLPDREPANSQFIQELAFPQACMRGEDYDCRVESQTKAWDRSRKLFNNTTKQDRYAEMKGHAPMSPDGGRLGPVPGGGGGRF